MFFVFVNAKLLNIMAQSHRHIIKYVGCKDTK